MSRLPATAAVLVALVLVGCSFAPSLTPEATPVETPLPTNFVEVFVHCGLDWPVIEWDGRAWKFVIEGEPDPNPPPGWGNEAVVQILPDGDGAIAIGPDGIERPLVEVESPQPSGVCF